MLRQEFADEVEFVEKGQMSLDHYLEFTKSVDVVVDQANSYTYGMSALFALARGQVVLSGNEPASHALGPYAHSPVVNIRPSATQIADKLRSLLRDRAELRRIGRLGPDYVRRYHSSDVVARRYLDLYEEVLTSRTGSSALP
jgi:glycosyltransferase involved in cell wall biosynthesis